MCYQRRNTFYLKSKIKPSELLQREVDMYSTGSWSGANKERSVWQVVSSVGGSMVTGSLHHISHYKEKVCLFESLDVSLCPLLSISWIFFIFSQKHLRVQLSSVPLQRPVNCLLRTGFEGTVSSLSLSFLSYFFFALLKGSFLLSSLPYNRITSINFVHFFFKKFTNI